MPAPNFQLNPYLLNQLAQGGGFNPGDAMLKGLALREDREQQSLQNAMTQRGMDLKERQMGLSEQQLQVKLDELKQQSAEKLKVEKAKRDTIEWVASRDDLTEEAKNQYAMLAQTDFDKANEYLLSLDDAEQKAEETRLTTRARLEEEQKFKKDEDQNLQKGGTVFDQTGETMGRADFHPKKGYVWANTDIPVPSDMQVVPATVTSTTAQGTGVFSEKTVEEAESSNINLTLVEDKLKQAEDMIRANPNVAGLPGKVIRDFLAPASQALDLIGAREAGESVREKIGATAATDYETLSELIISDFIEPVTKEESRFSDRDMERVRTVASVLKSTRAPEVILAQLKILRKAALVPLQIRNDIQTGELAAEDVKRLYDEGKIYRETAVKLLDDFFNPDGTRK